ASLRHWRLDLLLGVSLHQCNNPPDEDSQGDWFSLLAARGDDSDIADLPPSDAFHFPPYSTACTRLYLSILRAAGTLCSVYSFGVPDSRPQIPWSTAFPFQPRRRRLLASRRANFWPCPL